MRFRFRALFVGVSEGMDCIAMHVRHGDSCHDTYRGCAPLKEYMAAAESMRQTYGFKTIYMLTDDENATRDAQSYGQFKILFNSMINRSSMDPAKFKRKAKKGKKNWIENHIDQLGDHPFYDVLLDIYTASRCRAFVGGFDASLSHLVASLVCIRAR